MAEIVPISSGHSTETLLEFIEREGPLKTDSIARRFGWTLEKARAELKALHATGKLTSELETWHLGRIYGWRIKSEQK